MFGLFFLTDAIKSSKHPTDLEADMRARKCLTNLITVRNRDEKRRNTQSNYFDPKGNPRVLLMLFFCQFCQQQTNYQKSRGDCNC